MRRVAGRPSTLSASGRARVYARCMHLLRADLFCPVLRRSESEPFPLLNADEVGLNIPPQHVLT